MNFELTVLMPCLNEAKTLPNCIRKALDSIERIGISGEVLIADNGSTDGSQALAEQLGARVIHVPTRGYGAALAMGIGNAKGRYVIMGDCDESYDFDGLEPFVEKLREGYQLVMGNRFMGGISPGAMPPTHRYFGNPFLSGIGRLFFKIDKVHDFYCGLRGFEKSAVESLSLQSDGMEFALEMVIKSHQQKLRITEVPTTLVPDGRDRAPHLKTLRDGWRSLRFFLVMSPRWLFGAPGTLLILFGTLLSIPLSIGPLHIGSITLDFHTLVFSMTAIALGYQSIILGTFAKLVAIETGLHPKITKLGQLQKRGAMEFLLLTGSCLGLGGLALGIGATRTWWNVGFGNINDDTTIRLALASALFLTLGCQTVLAGGFLGFINLVIGRKNTATPQIQSGNTQASNDQKTNAS